MYAELVERLAKGGPKKTCNADSCPDYEGKLTALLSDLPDRYPQGDKRAEALWRLALRALRRGDLAAAQTYLGQSLAKIPRETGWDQEGRTLYWLGRVAELRSDRPTAQSHDERRPRVSAVVLHAALRCRDWGGLRYGRAKRCSVSSSAPTQSGLVTFSFAPRALFGHPAFLRGIELLRAWAWALRRGVSFSRSASPFPTIEPRAT